MYTNVAIEYAALTSFVRMRLTHRIKYTYICVCVRIIKSNRMTIGLFGLEHLNQVYICIYLKKKNAVDDSMNRLS